MVIKILSKNNNVFFENIISFNNIYNKDKKGEIIHVTSIKKYKIYGILIFKLIAHLIFLYFINIYI